jgi:UPF0755 protein
MRSSRRAKLHKTTSLLAWLAFFACVIGFWLTLQFLPLSPSCNRHELISVKPGDGVRTLAEKLSHQGIVRSKYAVYIAAALVPREILNHFQPGEYYVSPSQTAEEMLVEIGTGRMASARVIFPEGFTLNQIAERLQERGVVNADEFLSSARYDGYSFQCVDGFSPQSENLEGYLFPDEYDFAPDSTVRSVIQEMLDRFDDKVVKMHPLVKDWRTPLTVASMVERETSVESERPMVAGVIDNRLRIGMLLQIDATVQYALPEHKSRLLYSDLRVQSPYNTYLHKGLPPTPICSPGIQSINAALAPADIDYLYYVQGSNGRHLFGRTLAQQQRNIAIGMRGHLRTQ